MFDIFKKDINVGDKVKLYLITGKEPEGTVLEVGENYVFIQTDDQVHNRFFDKLIGGWDVIKIPSREVLFEDNTNHSIVNVNPESNLLQDKITNLINTTKENILNKIVEPNANIISVRGTTCIASNNEFQRILILNNKVNNNELIKEIESFHTGTIIPILIQYYSKKENEAIAIFLTKPDTVRNLINEVLNLALLEKYNDARSLLRLIKTNFSSTKELNDIIKELRKPSKDFNNTIPKKLNIQNPENAEDRKLFKHVEKEINELIRQSNFEKALSKINTELKIGIIDDKYKSSLLLKRAQIYSSIDDPIESENSYQDLIRFNEKIKTPANNLSHLYTELARIQALKNNKIDKAKESVKKALFYNPNNNFAINLLKNFEVEGSRTDFDNAINRGAGESLLIESDDESTTISKMIDIDIKEHKYSQPEIIRNGSKPTAFIAKSILDEAKKGADTDLSERYPLYLEAAKAFSELNVGSYDLQDYLESVAYYALMKGNSLFIDFRNRIHENNIDTIKLIRIKDSACSYYIESLNILSSIDSKYLVNLLANYLKLNIIIFHINNKNLIELKDIFKESLTSIFKDCLRSNDKGMESIAYKSIIDYGASSINAWNNLYHQNGINVLYGDFSSPDRKIKIFNLINNIEGTDIDMGLKPGEFLKNTFLERRKRIKKFTNNISHFLKLDLEPQNIDNVIRSWNSIEGFERYITLTDIEIKSEIDNLLLIIQPYLNRTEKERLNILIQARNIIEKQVKFINDNTTFYGRTFFYGLLNKWKKDIDFFLNEKIKQSYPSLSLIIDPPYYIETDGEVTVPLLIKNEGEATADGFSLKIDYNSKEYNEVIETYFETEIEISAEGQIETSLGIPPTILHESPYIELKIEIQAIYQKKKLTPKAFNFTIEKEPKSTLTYEDIPWRDGPITPEQLFKGRRKLIADLAQHYLSIEKDKPYILYGLTRTGKSSVLEYLKKNIEGNTFISRGKEMTVLTFSWDLSVAASFKKATDFWEYILHEQTFEQIEVFSSKYNFSLHGLNIKDNVRAKDFRIILDFLSSKNLYPLFLIDEFSFIKNLIDDGIINSAFLHTLRQFSINEVASFIFAGTYDIKNLIKDQQYGITGQLVNAIEEQVNEISDGSAEELIEVINNKLSFTPEAKNHIKFLSGNVPYFIQIICKSCGYYAAENKRRYIGYSELEKVVKILIGQEIASPKSLVKKLPENIFQNNQFSPADPKEVAVLISSLAYLNKDRIRDPRGIGFAELQKLWADKKINAFRPKLAEAINLLKEKKIIIQDEDEGTPVYKLSVDLFRRWWINHNPDINLTLTILTE